MVYELTPIKVENMVYEMIQVAPIKESFEHYTRNNYTIFRFIIKFI